MEQRFRRGDQVAVKVIDGKELTLIYWEQKRGMILVTNEQEFKKLQAGRPALWPVAFHPEEVRWLGRSEKVPS